jgi:hypothetical protein
LFDAIVRSRAPLSRNASIRSNGLPHNQNPTNGNGHTIAGDARKGLSRALSHLVHELISIMWSHRRDP